MKPSIAAATVGVIATAIILTGAIEHRMRLKAVREFPLAGRYIRLDGRSLQLDCQGTGSPTVVFESGLDTLGMLSWSRVQGPIARLTRACAYNRAGILGSDPDRRAFEPDAVARDLHAALEREGIRPPLVLVGHSLGGPYSMNFVRLYPSEVAGLVFVDPSHPDQLNRFAKVFNETHPPPIPLKLRLATWLAWLGYARWFPEFRATPRAPDRVRAEADAYVSTSAGPLLREQESIAQTLIQAGRLRHLGDRPVIVLTAVDTMAPEDLRDLGWTAEQGNNFLAARKALHEDEASWSSHGRDQLVMGSTHYIQFDKPQAVINAVSEVIAVVQGNCPASNIPHLTTLLFAAQACQKPKECMGNCGA